MRKSILIFILLAILGILLFTSSRSIYLQPGLSSSNATLKQVTVPRKVSVVGDTHINFNFMACEGSDQSIMSFHEGSGALFSHLPLPDQRILKIVAGSEPKQGKKEGKGLMWSAATFDPSQLSPKSLLSQAFKSRRLVCSNGHVQLIEWLPSPSAVQRSSPVPSMNHTHANHTQLHLSPYIMGCDIGSATGATAQLVTRMCFDYTSLLPSNSDLYKEEAHCSSSVYKVSPASDIITVLSSGEKRSSYMQYAASEELCLDRLVNGSLNANTYGTIKLTTRSEIKKAQRFAVAHNPYVSFNVPLVPAYMSEMPSSIHVMYLHEKRYETNLGHVLYRVINLLRTARGINQKLRLGDEVPTFKLVALLTLEASGRTMGPFMVPFLKASKLFDDVIVVPDDGYELNESSVKMERTIYDAHVTGEQLTITETSRVRSQVFEEGPPPTQLLAKVEQSPKSIFILPPQKGLPNKAMMTPPLPVLLATSSMQCFDNVVTSSRGSPQFGQPAHGDQFLVDTISEFHKHLVLSWRLKTQCALGEAGGGVIRITFINRKETRRIQNMEALQKAVAAALQTTYCPNSVLNPDSAPLPMLCKYQFTFATIELENLSYSLSAQAATLYCSDIVVCVHGAATAWSIAMRSGTSLIELLPYGWQAIADQGTTPLYQSIFDGVGIVHSELWLSDHSHSLNNERTKKRAFGGNFSLQARELKRVELAILKETKRLLGSG